VRLRDKLNGSSKLILLMFEKVVLFNPGSSGATLVRDKDKLRQERRFSNYRWSAAPMRLANSVGEPMARDIGIIKALTTMSPHMAIE